VTSSNGGIADIKHTVDMLIRSEKSLEACYIDVAWITSACKKLKSEKHDGHEEIWSNMLKKAPLNCYKTLACCFTGMLIHGYYPSEILVYSIVSLPKDLKGDMTSADNYRGICLTSAVNKIFDYVMLEKKQ
jgi:hypothetical protein